MLPVYAWPPSVPGASLSPFGKTHQVCVSSCGCIIPPGAWIVGTTSNSVVMFFPRCDPWVGVNQTPGTGLVPGQIPPPPNPPQPPPPCSPPPQWLPYNDLVAAWRAWQRQIGRTDPVQRPLPGRQPPNFFGWKYVNAPSRTLVGPNSGGLVIADGENVVITGGGNATLTQAYSV